MSYALSPQSLPEQFTPPGLFRPWQTPASLRSLGSNNQLYEKHLWPLSQDNNEATINNKCSEGISNFCLQTVRSLLWLCREEKNQLEHKRRHCGRGEMAEAKHQGRAGTREHEFKVDSCSVVSLQQTEGPCCEENMCRETVPFKRGEANNRTTLRLNREVLHCLPFFS